MSKVQKDSSRRMETMVEGWRYQGLGCRSTALEEWKQCCTMADGWRYQCLGCRRTAAQEGKQWWKDRDINVQAAEGQQQKTEKIGKS